METEDPLKLFAKAYFSNLLQHEHPNMKWGDELNFAVRYRREDGSWYTAHSVTVTKDELKDE